MPTLVVGWDHDKVLVPDFGTSYLAKGSPLDPEPYIDRFVKEGLFARSDVERWQTDKGRQVRNVGDLADCLTTFMYEYGILNKGQTVYAKNAILAGLTVFDIRRITDGIPYSLGAQEAVRGLREMELRQTLFSDSNGVVVDRQIERNAFHAGGGVPPYVQVREHPEGVAGQKELYRTDTHFGNLDATLTGEMGEFNKAEAFFGWFRGVKVPLDQVAVIDDSGANVNSLLVPVRDAGGLAVGFNPTEAHRKDFAASSMPILRGKDLRAFAEIVLDASKLGQYTE